MSGVSNFLHLLTWRDALDVLLVAVVIYNLLLLIRGTRAVQIVYGILLLVGVYYLARLGNLLTLETALSAFLTFLRETGASFRRMRTRCARSRESARIPPARFAAVPFANGLRFSTPTSPACCFGCSSRKAIRRVMR